MLAIRAYSFVDWHVNAEATPIHSPGSWDATAALRRAGY